MTQLPVSFTKALLFAVDKLSGRQYAIRGTTSLVLQGIDMNVTDIDIVCNKETALACNDIFQKFLVDKIKYSESKQFKSYFGKIEYEGVQIEIMGNWMINSKGRWSEPFDGSKYTEVEIEEIKVKVTTIDSELEMFTQMGRWTALQKIKRQLLPKQRTDDAEQLSLL